MSTKRNRQNSDEETTTAGVDAEVRLEEGGASLADLEARLEYHFARPELLELALTHRSFPYEARIGAVEAELRAKPYVDSREQRNQPGLDNEQLEFLGDAVLGLAITEALFDEFPECSEGELTRLRASLVSRKRMAQMGVELGLSDHLRLGRSAEQNGSRKKPALLANTSEAVIAAVYLDALRRDGKTAERNGLVAIRALVERFLLAPERVAMHEALDGNLGTGALRDHKTLLQERVQAESAGRLRYVDVAQSGPAHQRVFAVEARLENEDGVRTLAAAEGPSKKEAQQRAAEIALVHWKPTPEKAEASVGSGR
ncbi:MAG: ribonuclease III [Acidobacteriota bacterium]